MLHQQIRWIRYLDVVSVQSMDNGQSCNIYFICYHRQEELPNLIIDQVHIVFTFSLLSTLREQAANPPVHALDCSVGRGVIRAHSEHHWTRYSPGF